MKHKGANKHGNKKQINVVVTGPCRLVRSASQRRDRFWAILGLHCGVVVPYRFVDSRNATGRDRKR